MIIIAFPRGEKVEKRKKKNSILKESRGKAWKYLGICLFISSKEAKEPFLSKASVWHTLDNIPSAAAGRSDPNRDNCSITAKADFD